jgi:hypothetical protein
MLPQMSVDFTRNKQTANNIKLRYLFVPHSYNNIRHVEKWVHFLHI